MGNNCGNDQNPDIINRCGIPVGDQYEMGGFCTIEGEQGDGYRSEYCSLMSNAGEWGDPVAFESCFYDDCHPYSRTTSGCCSGCCGIVGRGLACTRKSFAGDPVTCCFNDLNCTGLSPGDNPVQCYSDGTSRQKTCDDGSGGRNYRSLTSTDCQDVLLQYCTGTLPTDDPNSTEWLNRWTTGGNRSCSYALARNLFRGSAPCLTTIPTTTPGVCTLPPALPYDAEGYFWGQQLMNETMLRYEQNFNIGALPGTPGYNIFQDTLYSTCCSYPGICSQGLTNVCSTKTAQRISFNVTESNFCGCHLPQGEYEENSVKFNIPSECAPICNRVGVIPTTGISGEPVLCKQSTCIIDDITINVISSQIGGGLDFNQICQQCSANTQCSCIISNNTFDIVNSTINGQFIPTAQNCGNVTCQQTNIGPTGPTQISVDCNPGTTGNTNPYAEYQAKLAQEEAAAKLDSFLWTLLAIAIGLFLIWLFIYVLVPQNTTSNNISITKQSPTTFARDTSNYNSILNYF